MNRYSRTAAAAVLAFAIGGLSGQTPEAAPVIDGKLDDPFWKTIEMRPFQPAEKGVPQALGGSFGAAVLGEWLCLAARLPEPGGKVLARAIGREPVWQKDAYGAPAVEDRVEYRLRYRAAAGDSEHTLTVSVNPWGAYRVELDGSAAPGEKVEVAALVTSGGWSVEAALPLGLLAVDRRAGWPALRLEAERIRSRRALAPEFHWSVTFAVPATPAGKQTGAPALQPPALGNTEPALRVGRVSAVPPISSKWEDPFWLGVPAFSLPLNEPYPRAPHFGTKVKWVHDGRTLALLARAEEPEPLVARTGGRDSNFAADDHLAIHLATSGSTFVEVLVNTVGGVRDSLVLGGPHMTSPQTSWNAAIQAQTDIDYGAWTARVDLPLLEIAKALGETGMPESWRIVVSRYRAARAGDAAEVSALPPVGTESFSGPIRYRRLVLSEEGAGRVPAVSTASVAGMAGELRRLDAHVWPALYRRSHQVRSMVAIEQRQRAERAVAAERAAWDAIKTRAEWEKFRDQRLAALRQAVGRFPPERVPLDERVTARRSGLGYRLENLVYQSRPGFYVPANLYLPADPSPSPIPAIIILHSFHYPKTQGELHDMGELWARTGCAVLIPERLGFGERVETTPWYRQAYRSRYLLRQQLNLIGESLIGWMAWDTIRAVDLLYARAGIDRNRIILMGAVAGGAEPAAVAAALDPRISALVAYNYDHGQVRLGADFSGELPKQINMSLVANSIAPRRYVHAFEFGWEGAEESDFPNLWISSWERSRKIWDLYGAGENLAAARGYGLIRLSMERVSHSWSIGPQHRAGLYPILERWFQIPPPSAEDQAILPDSELSVNPYREQARMQEAQRRRPLADLLSIPPSVSAQLPRKLLHQVAYAMATEELASARRRQGGRLRLRADIAGKLGDTSAARQPRADAAWTRSLPGATVEAMALGVEDGITVPLLLIRPVGTARAPVVVAVGQQGKGRFLASRSGEIERLLGAGVAVCLPDLRGTGETAPEPDWYNQGRNLAETEVALGGTLAGARVKDLRTVLAWLRGRADLGRIALWGDSFAPPNTPDLFLDEMEQEAGPQVQYHAEPQGCAAALFASLLEDDIQAVACRGGLASYLSILENAFAYVPADAIVPGILKAGDVVDIAAVYAPRPLLLEGLVNGRNIRLTSAELARTLNLVQQAYEKSGSKDGLTLRAEPGDLAGWVISQLTAAARSQGGGGRKSH